MSLCQLVHPPLILAKAKTKLKLIRNSFLYIVVARLAYMDASKNTAEDESKKIQPDFTEDESGKLRQFRHYNF